MDNKQKKQILKLIYKTIILLIFICAGFTIYFGVALQQMEYKYSFVGIIFIVLACLTIISALFDSYQTTNIKNKFNLSLFTYTLMIMSLVVSTITTAAIVASNAEISGLYTASLVLLLTSQILLIVNIIVGLKLSKLVLNTTITIDSTSETPNYNDELILKKKLDELERKLEMKRVQEKIDKVQKELDND